MQSQTKYEFLQPAYHGQDETIFRLDPSNKLVSPDLILTGVGASLVQVDASDRAEYPYNLGVLNCITDISLQINDSYVEQLTDLRNINAVRMTARKPGDALDITGLNRIQLALEKPISGVYSGEVIPKNYDKDRTFTVSITDLTNCKLGQFSHVKLTQQLDSLAGMQDMGAWLDLRRLEIIIRIRWNTNISTYPYVMLNGAVANGQSILINKPSLMVETSTDPEDLSAMDELYRKGFTVQHDTFVREFLNLPTVTNANFTTAIAQTNVQLNSVVGKTVNYMMANVNSTDGVAIDNLVNLIGVSTCRYAGGIAMNLERMDLTINNIKYLPKNQLVDIGFKRYLRSLVLGQTLKTDLSDAFSYNTANAGYINFPDTCVKDSVPNGVLAAQTPTTLMKLYGSPFVMPIYDKVQQPIQMTYDLNSSTLFQRAITPIMTIQSSIKRVLALKDRSIAVGDF